MGSDAQVLRPGGPEVPGGAVQAGVGVGPQDARVNAVGEAAVNDGVEVLVVMCHHNPLPSLKPRRPLLQRVKRGPQPVAPISITTPLPVVTGAGIESADYEDQPVFTDGQVKDSTVGGFYLDPLHAATIGRWGGKVASFLGAAVFLGLKNV